MGNRTSIKRGLPCIVVNLNGKRSMDSERCPVIIRNELAIHISFNAKILQYALENWPESYERKLKEGKRVHTTTQKIRIRNWGYRTKFVVKNTLKNGDKL